LIDFVHFLTRIGCQCNRNSTKRCKIIIFNSIKDLIEKIKKKFMIFVSFATALLVAASILIHGLALNYLEISKIKKINYLIFAKFSLVLFISHLLHIFLFAFFYSYYFHTQGGPSSFGGSLQNEFIDFFYFSISCYTTLGIGDVFPLGVIRITSGIEALVGLMLIAWTATFKLTYLLKIRK